MASEGGSSTRPGVAQLPSAHVRDALELLREPSAAGRSAGVRALREVLARYGLVRSLLERAPDGAKQAFVRLVHHGPAAVEDLLGRGWWGHGLLPPPLDWLQRRALVLVGSDGLVHATREAAAAFTDLTLDLEPLAPVEPLRIEPARCVVVAPTPSALDRALTVVSARLRAVAPTVALSSSAPAAVEQALRDAGVAVVQTVPVAANISEPALPGTVEQAVGPRAVRTLLERALAEGRQVQLDYYASSRAGAATVRVVDPWSFRDDLLSGYCHLRGGERTFAVDRIGHARLLPTAREHAQPD